jgi:ribokinase
VTKEQVASTFENFGEGDYLLLQNEINCLTEIVDAAAERGMVICLNPSPYDDRLNGVDLSKVSLLIVNEVEAAGIAGVSDPESVWEVLHARYPEMALVETLGELGSVAFSGDIRVDQAAFTCEAVDTTGAGDTFTGYLIARMMEGCSLEEGMAWASVASGIAVTRPGAAASIPTSDEVEAML